MATVDSSLTCNVQTTTGSTAFLKPFVDIHDPFIAGIPCYLLLLRIYIVSVCVQIILTVLYNIDRVVFLGHVCSPELLIKDLRHIVEELGYIMPCFCY